MAGVDSKDGAWPTSRSPLNDDQLQLKEWIHDFAVDVMRPAAEEWDEREEFPWPIVQEAAKIGLYGFDFMANAMLGDPTGLTLPIAIEELFWGDAGIGLSIMGSGLAAAGIAGNGTPEQMIEWVPQCYGTADDVQARRVLRVRARRRLRRVARCAPGPSTTRPTTSGCSTAPRRGSPTAASPTSTSWWRRSTPSSGRGQASFVVPPGTPGLSQGQKYKKHGIRASHTAEVVLDDVRIPGRCLLGGKDKLDDKLARAREARKPKTRRPASSRRWPPSRPPAPPSAPWPSASPVPPTSTRSSTPRSARRSASRSS